jgi:hypothetical protein
MHKNNPKKIGYKELNEHTLITGKNICKKCKRQALFLYDGHCEKCLHLEPLEDVS